MGMLNPQSEQNHLLIKATHAPCAPRHHLILTMHGQHSVMDDTTDVKDPVVVEHVEDRSSSSYVDNLDSTLLDTSLRAQAERKLVRKLDWRLLPTIILIFIMNYIDVRRISSLHYVLV